MANNKFSAAPKNTCSTIVLTAICPSPSRISPPMWEGVQICKTEIIQMFFGGQRDKIPHRRGAWQGQGQGLWGTDNGSKSHKGNVTLCQAAGQQAKKSYSRNEPNHTLNVRACCCRIWENISWVGGRLGAWHGGAMRGGAGCPSVTCLQSI